MTAIEEALSNNARYAETFDKCDLPLPPARNLAVVVCMDARLDTYKLLGLKVVRALGLRLQATASTGTTSD